MRQASASTRGSVSVSAEDTASPRMAAIPARLVARSSRIPTWSGASPEPTRKTEWKPSNHCTAAPSAPVRRCARSTIVCVTASGSSSSAEISCCVCTIACSWPRLVRSRVSFRFRWVMSRSVEWTRPSSSTRLEYSTSIKIPSLRRNARSARTSPSSISCAIRAASAAASESADSASAGIVRSSSVVYQSRADAAVFASRILPSRSHTSVASAAWACRSRYCRSLAASRSTRLALRSAIAADCASSRVVSTSTSPNASGSCAAHAEHAARFAVVDDRSEDDRACDCRRVSDRLMSAPVRAQHGVPRHSRRIRLPSVSLDRHVRPEAARLRRALTVK